MMESNLVQLAQAGDADAIALLMNSTLQAIGIRAKVVLREGVLHVLLESERILAQTPCLEFIRRGIARLGLAWLSSAVVYSRVSGQPTPVWIQQIDLSHFNLANPFTLSPNARIDAAGVLVRLPSLKRKQVRLFNLLLLSVPILVVLSSLQIWNRYLLNTGSSSTSTTGVSRSSGDGLSPGASSATSDPYNKAIQAALKAVAVGKTAETKEEWRQAVAGWQQAIAAMKSVPQSHSKYTVAQQKIQTYEQNLASLIEAKLSRQGMELKKVIEGGISPKSIVYSGTDRFFAQNMMYSHSITVYDRDFNLVKTLSDKVKLADYGYPQFKGSQQGAPVEAAFSKDGQTAWVSNYQMYGTGFGTTADDDCSPQQNLDSSFVYRINARNLNIERVVQVGAVPKYVATVPNNRYVLVSNWCSWDISVIDTQQNKEVRRIQVGPYPRGIVVDPNSQMAYVAVMGSYDIATIDLKTFALGWLKNVGHSPRHLEIDPGGKYLYATLNGEGKVAKIDRATHQVISKVATGNAPRSMTISHDGAFIYVVNYNSDTVSKVRTKDMKVVQEVKVNPAPIGITYDHKTHQVWVACYSGSILVFQD